MPPPKILTGDVNSRKLRGIKPRNVSDGELLGAFFDLTRVRGAETGEFMDTVAMMVGYG